MSTFAAPLPATSAAALRSEISRFMEAVRLRSEHDLDTIRRTRRRFQRSWPLLVFYGGEREDAGRSVALHNASEMGIGFLSPRPIPEGETIRIRLFWHDEDRPVVPAVVRHSTPARHGYLIGAQFLLPDELTGLSPISSDRAEWE